MFALKCTWIICLPPSVIDGNAKIEHNVTTTSSRNQCPRDVIIRNGDNDDTTHDERMDLSL